MKINLYKKFEGFYLSKLTSTGYIIPVHFYRGRYCGSLVQFNILIESYCDFDLQKLLRDIKEDLIKRELLREFEVLNDF